MTEVPKYTYIVCSFQQMQKIAIQDPFPLECYGHYITWDMAYERMRDVSKYQNYLLVIEHPTCLIVGKLVQKYVLAKDPLRPPIEYFLRKPGTWTWDGSTNYE